MPCNSKVISRATLEIVNNENLNKPLKHKSNAPIKKNLTSDLKRKNFNFDEHFHLDLEIKGSCNPLMSQWC